MWKWGAYLGDEGLKNGIRAKISSYTRYQVNTAMTKAKACGYYINSILAKREAISLGYDEAIMLDVDGFISEASGENIFIVRKGTLMTPPISMGALEGITRNAVLDIAEKLTLDAKENIFTRHDIFISEECFLTGTAAELIPVVKVDGRLIGAGLPGPVTRRILAEFKKMTKKDGVKYSV